MILQGFVIDKTKFREATVAKVKAVRNALLEASDHFPVSAVRDF
jgi:hypothetical protein